MVNRQQGDRQCVPHPSTWGGEGHVNWDTTCNTALGAAAVNTQTRQDPRMAHSPNALRSVAGVFWSMNATCRGTERRALPHLVASGAEQEGPVVRTSWFTAPPCLNGLVAPYVQGHALCSTAFMSEGQQPTLTSREAYVRRLARRLVRS